MKKIALVLVFLMCFGCALSATCQGSITLNGEYMADTKTLEISGTTTLKEGTVLTITVYPQTESNLTSELINSDCGFAKLVYTDSVGSYGLTIALPDALKSSPYTLKVSAEGGSASYGFIHVNDAQAAQALAYINVAASSDIMGTKIKDSLFDFGIDSSAYAKHEELIVPKLFGLRQNYYKMAMTSEEYLQSLYGIILFGEIRSGALFDTAIQTYADKVGVDLAAYYNGYQPSILQKTASYLKADSALLKPFKVSYRESLIMAQIDECERPAELQAVFINNNDFIGASLGVYNTLDDSKKLKAFELMHTSESLNKFENLVSLFGSCCTEAAKKNGLTQDDVQIPGPSGSTKPSSSYSGPASSGGSSAGITAPLPPVSEGGYASSAGFSDTLNHWCEANVKRLVSMGAINGFGDGTFRPEEFVTRAQFVKLIAETFGIEKSSGDEFSDVDGDSWYAPYVYGAKNFGLVEGTDGRMNPDADISRQDAALIMYRLLELKGDAPFGVFMFKDDNSVADYAKDAVSALGGAEILKGTDSYFMPLKNTTRAEAVTMIVNIIDYLG